MQINIGIIKVNIITNIASLNVGKTILCRNSSAETNYPEAPTSKSAHFEGQLNAAGAFPLPVTAANFPQALKLPKIPKLPPLTASTPSIPPINAPGFIGPLPGIGGSTFVPINPAAP